MRADRRFGLRRAAFTLVELLVTIAIVALLAALLMGATRSALNSSREAKCVGNMRQLALGFQGYLANNNNVLPQRYSGMVNGVRWGYPERLLEYMSDDARVFKCPSQPGNDYPEEPSYGMNWYYDNEPVTIVETPSRTILVAETMGNTGTGSRRADRDSGTPGELDSERHRGKANYLFFDGHLERLAWDDTIEPVDLWGTDSGNHSPLTQ